MFRIATFLLFVTMAPVPAFGQLDTAEWDRLLGSAVSNGQVEYSRWRDNPRFDALVEQVGLTETGGMDRSQKLAFYINAYNLLAARGILDGRSPDGVLGRYLYFKRDKYLVSGEQISLHQLEHEWIRPLKEPRIHFAIVCASQSCPILQSEAYTAERLDEQLQQAAQGFINDASRNRFDPAGGRAEISMIFKWFEEDFLEASGSIQAYLAPFVADSRAVSLLSREGFDISYLEYDWSLNGEL